MTSSVHRIGERQRQMSGKHLSRMGRRTMRRHVHPPIEAAPLKISSEPFSLNGWIMRQL
jgi:hypothetical protein